MPSVEHGGLWKPTQTDHSAQETVRYLRSALVPKKRDDISVRAPQGTRYNRAVFPPVNKLGNQLNKIEIKHRRAYPSAEASMISLVEFPPSESAENCLGTNSEGVIRSSSYFVKIWI